MVDLGLAPALLVGRRDLNEPLRDSGKGLAGGTKHSRLRDAVVVLEVALSLTLLVGAGLLMRSFVALREERLGFHPDHVLFTRMPLPQDRYKTSEQLAGFFRPLLGGLKAPAIAKSIEEQVLVQDAIAELRRSAALGGPRGNARRLDAELDEVLEGVRTRLTTLSDQLGRVYFSRGTGAQQLVRIA